MEELITILSYTFQNSKQLRLEAESYLNAHDQDAGFLQALLQIAVSEANVGIRQAAAVYLKNAIKRMWADRPSSASPLSNEVKVRLHHILSY